MAEFCFRVIFSTLFVASLTISMCFGASNNRSQSQDIYNSIKNASLTWNQDGDVDYILDQNDEDVVMNDGPFDFTKIIPGIQGSLVWSAKTKSSNSDKNRRRQFIQYLLKGKIVYDYFLLERDGSTADSIKPGSNLKVLLHGFTQHDEPMEDKITRSKMFMLADEYLASGIPNLEVVVVDWTELSSYPPYKYQEAADSTQYVGVDVASFLINLSKRGIVPLDNVHIIGYSLGAHVAGVAGYIIHEKTGKKVGRITGIDPAGPMFVEGNALISDKRMALDKTDAQFVDIIHCNMGEILDAQWGSKVQAGHADFYPNGGKTQRGCDTISDATQGCSHSICPLYFVQSVKQKRFPACRCASWKMYNNRKYRCDCHDYAVEMGERLNTSIASGRYYLHI